MNFRRWKYPVLACALITAVAVFFYFHIENDLAAASTPINQDTILVAPSHSQEVAIQQFKQNKALKNVEKAIEDARQVLIAEVPTQESWPDDTIPWQINSPEEQLQPSIPLNDKVINYAAVKVNPHPEHLPSEGEKMQLPMLNGRALVATVESVTTTANGDYIWTGHIEGQGNDFPVVMTYGEALTFATINTPEGSYTLESHNGIGWLYKNPSVADLSAPGSVDFLEPDEKLVKSSESNP